MKKEKREGEGEGGGGGDGWLRRSHRVQVTGIKQVSGVEEQRARG